MSDKTKEQLLEEQLNAELPTPPADERKELMQRADDMGISYAKNISTPKLRELVLAKLNGEEVEYSQEENNTVVPASTGKPKSRGELRAEALALVRFTMVCQNPDRQQMPSITITFNNNIVGQVTHVLPLSPEFYKNGWHAPRCIVEQLKQKTFSQHRTETSKIDKRTRNTKLVQVPEFIITELPPLTPEELAALAKRQANSGSLQDND